MNAIANPTPQQVLAQIQALAQNRKIVLHIGCGAPNPEKLHKRYRSAEWFELRFDLNPAVTPHIIGDMKDLSMLPDACVDAVWNSHTIEHLFAHEVPVALKEWFRVIKPNGEILTTLPDIQSVAAEVAKGRLEDALYTSPAGPITGLDILYGYGKDIARGVIFMAHKTGFTAETLGRKLQDAGFAKVKMVVKGYDLWAEAKRPEAPVTTREAIEITRDKPLESTAAVATDPARHPGLLWKGKRADELDVPPTAL